MKKNKTINKLLLLFLIVAVIFGIYSLFFSEHANNSKFYINNNIKLLSYNDLINNNVKPDKIDDLLIDLHGELSLSDLSNINNKYNLSNVLGEFIKNITGQKDENKYNVYVYEDLMINFNDDVTAEDIKNIENEYGIKLKLNSKFSQDDKLYIFKPATSKTNEIAKLLKRLTNEKNIEYAQPSYMYAVSQFKSQAGGGANVSSAVGSGTNEISKEKKFKPNDPMYPDQWNMRDIGMEGAWAVTKGKGAVVAVIDTGVYKVEDLKDTKFAKGYNFVSNNTDASDDHGHGTHVAGTIAQSTNNGKGVAGIAPEASIMPLKVLNKNGYGNLTDIAEAIKWAADNGANVINMSLGGGGRNQVMEDAVKYAQKKGVVVVAAAGNENRNRASYPAYYKDVVSVASYGPKGSRAFYSNYGDGVRISAPGGDDRAGMGEKGKILQNTIKIQKPGQEEYAYYQGTSMASPHVAGVSALIISSGVKDPNKVIDILYKSARKVDSDPKNEFGAGKLNAENAVLMASGGEAPAGEGLPLGTIKMFIYIIATIIALILFFVWYSRMKSLYRNDHLAFLPFIIGILISTIGLILPIIFGSNGFTRLLSSPVHYFDTMLFGAYTPLFHSALIPVVLIVLFAGSKFMKSFSVAFSLGYAVVLIIDAVILFNDVAVIPNFTSINIIDRVFLLINALICLILALVSSKRSE